MRHPQASIAHVSTFPPLRCGIASFVSDIIAAIPSLKHVRYALRYDDAPDQNDASANVHSKDALTDLAAQISKSRCDLVSLQHEFGIWGGRDGEHIHAFLDNLSKPFVVVLHTTAGPDAKQSSARTKIVERLVTRAQRTIVLTELSKVNTVNLLGGMRGRFAIIPHGVPDFPYVPPPAVRNELAPHQPTLRMISPGFFREDKGLEVILHAIRELRDLGRSVSYEIAGEPQRQFEGQARYRDRIQSLIRSLALNDVVTIRDVYLALSEQGAAIQSAHLGLFGYQEPMHASSGTVPLVMALGRPVICTPFEYAKSKATQHAGVILAAAYDSTSIAKAIDHFIHTASHLELARLTYDETRSWTWAKVGQLYRHLYLDCLSPTKT